MEPRYVSGKIVCEKWGVTPEFLKNRRENGDFPYYKPEGTKIIFYKPEEIDAWIEASSKPKVIRT